MIWVHHLRRVLWTAVRTVCKSPLLLSSLHSGTQTLSFMHMRVFLSCFSPSALDLVCHSFTHSLTVSQRGKAVLSPRLKIMEVLTLLNSRVMALFVRFVRFDGILIIGTRDDLKALGSDDESSLTPPTWINLPRSRIGAL